MQFENHTGSLFNTTGIAASNTGKQAENDIITGSEDGSLLIIQAPHHQGSKQNTL